MRIPAFFSSPGTSNTPACTITQPGRFHNLLPCKRGLAEAAATRTPWLYAALATLLILIAGCGAPQETLGSSALLTVPSTVDFGAVTVGQSSSSTVQITNSSPSVMTIASMAITGSGFSLAGQTTTPFSLQPSQSTSIGIAFSPSSTGTATGTLTFSSNIKGAGSNTVHLTGQGQSKKTASLSGLTCASTSITGAGTDSCTVTLTAAAGSGGSSVALTSSSSALSVPASVTVPSGATTASFTATATAVTTAQTATLTASLSGVSQTFSIQLTAVSAQIGLSPTSLAFGSVTIGSPATQSVTILSTGTSALTINSATISGTGFSLTATTLPLTINPGQSATLQVTFNPTSATTYTGSLAIGSNAASGATSAVPLSGSGVSAVYSVALNWAAPSSSTDPVAGYDIYRAPGGTTTYQLLNTSPTTATTYTDTTVASGQSYLYYVVSVDSSGNESSPSNTYSATIP